MHGHRNLKLKNVPRITDFCCFIYVFGCRLSLVRLCDIDFGITPIDDITIGITCAVFCFHMADISFILLLLLLLLLLKHVIINAWWSYYISNKFHLEEFYKKEHVEVTVAATTSCWNRTL